MNAAALSRDALMPRAPGGLGRGLVLALLAHVLLIVALSFSIDWHTSGSPDAAEAELWAAVPQAAAPRAAVPTPQPATPPPQPPPVPPSDRRPAPVERPLAPVERPAAVKELPDAQISVERKQREQQREADEQAAKKAAADRARQQQAAADTARAREAQKADTRRQQADAAKQVELQSARIEKQRQDNLKRMLGEAGGSGAPSATGSAAQSAGPSADYIGRIKGRIRPNVSFPNILDGNPAVEVEVRVAPDGRIVGSRVVKKSGAPEWDDAVLRAIDKTEVLPRDENGRVPPVMTIVYRPRD